MRFIEGPLRRSEHSASTPGDPKTSFATDLPQSAVVPPMSFLTTTAVYSAPRPAGLLHPAPGHGVRLVSRRSYPKIRLTSSQARYPSKLSPLWQHFFGQGPRLCSPSLPPEVDALSLLVPRALRVATLLLVSPASGLCSTKESVAHIMTLPSWGARCSLGFMV